MEQSVRYLFAGAPAYEASKLIYDSGYLILASDFEKSEATATECGMRSVLASIYNEGGYIFGAKIRQGIWEQQDIESTNSICYNLHDPNIRNVFCTPR